MQINLLLVAANATVSATIATTSTSGSSTSSKLLAINQIICQMYVIVILISVATGVLLGYCGGTLVCSYYDFTDARR